MPQAPQPQFFLWGENHRGCSLHCLGAATRRWIIDEELQTREVVGVALPLLEAVPRLALMAQDELQNASASVALWSRAAKLALDLVARERLVPRTVTCEGHVEARFAVALGMPEDSERVSQLAKSMPLAAHAVPISNKRGAVTDATEVWAPESLLRCFLDTTADALVRAAVAPTRVRSRGMKTKNSAAESWPARWIAALSGTDATFVTEGFQERTLIEDLDTWSRPALGSDPNAPRVCFRLELPEDDSRGAKSRFKLRFLLQAAADPSLLIPAADIYASGDTALKPFCVTRRVAEERLLHALAIAQRFYPPIEAALRTSLPDAIDLTPDLAWTFIADVAASLTEAGIVVMLPAELTRTGQRRLKLRMRVGNKSSTSSASSGGANVSHDELVAFRWEAEIGGEALSARDLEALAKLKAPLVRHRGRWVAVDPRELEHARVLLAQGEGRMSQHAALAAALGDSIQQPDSNITSEVVAEGDLAQLLECLRAEPEHAAVVVPATFNGTLRPYQMCGLGWLTQMAELGLGACLADDMGLGKTIQLLAFLLQRSDANALQGPTLLVCPTSVVGNWQRELARFAPTLPTVPHFGGERARTANAFAASLSGTVVITTYGLLRRDIDVLKAVPWTNVVLDEAQNIKNSASRTARAARALRAQFRVALTGTPVENRLSELWSISEFLNTGLLGPLEPFRRDIAIPIERYNRDDIAEKLKRVVRPFILRRVKSDPAIIQDLPPKQEMKVFCTLTREQASLYQAAIDESLESIETSTGIERRGRVLALITALKQICNHPTQYLHDSSVLAGRSGKLARLCEMIEEVLAAGDRALIFTQYRAMGERLVSELARVFGTTVAFLHGGVPKEARDKMVERFQTDGGPRLFVLSVKAGGTGLNITAANHVFHYDRWWNPAVEDQATDRAYRIGQRRSVQVHKLMCAGTVEEKIDRLLETKRDLADRIVGAGEQWITELDSASLRELLSLAPDAAIAADETDESETPARKPKRLRKRASRAGATV